MQKENVSNKTIAEVMTKRVAELERKLKEQLHEAQERIKQLDQFEPLQRELADLKQKYAHL